MKEVQRVLKERGFYTGAIDGLWGRQMDAALIAAQSKLKHYRSDVRPHWTRERQASAWAQLIVMKEGHEPGAIDGIVGPASLQAFEDFHDARAGKIVAVLRTPIDRVGGRTPAQMRFPLQKDIESFYGEAGNPDCTRGVVKLPIPFRLAWDKSKTVNSFKCHVKVADALTAIYEDAVEHYGAEEFKRLDLDLWGGCFNNRNMRGGSQKSTHAYGAAVDHDPERNQLRWDASRAVFARDEYKAFFDIVEKHGGVAAGREWGKDWMHIQFARLK